MPSSQSMIKEPTNQPTNGLLSILAQMKGSPDLGDGKGVPLDKELGREDHNSWVSGMKNQDHTCSSSEDLLLKLIHKNVVN